mgnify:CR=1 FL=1
MRDYLGGQMEQTDYELLKECCLGEAEELKKQIFDLREQQRYQAETLTEKKPVARRVWRAGPPLPSDKGAGRFPD